ncbi:endonuclease domain-containing protein [Candidatus Accumulibacter phosphatis]|uniref:Endonuclease domain-containing protein n=1 Tax=Candidatus Accumulibacter contiguus TaxID=2954381 RepID=A0ABX1TDP1_9PROT|nr:endonuclease domain-containing protein [Candidatus Accumulibacter contiguus]
MLWQHLRGHRLNGEKFRRQQAIGPYVVDFVHFAARVVAEADGGQHKVSPGDERREAWLKSQGFRVLRFWNHEICNDTAVVLEAALTAVEYRHPLSPDPSPARGEQLCSQSSFF